jgi:hypothetical protein
VPPAPAYPHFLKTLRVHAAEVDAFFDEWVERWRAEWPDFGRVLAVDGKALRTHARPRKKGAPAPPDGVWRVRGRTGDAEVPVPGVALRGRGRGSGDVRGEGVGAGAAGVDRRIFTPLARASYAWKRLYKKRTGVERVNRRLDVSFGFERPFIRGLGKRRRRMGLALGVMLAMARGRVKEKPREKRRSLVQAA